MPKNAAIHIQKTAPGPPRQMAAETPAILPVPIVAARAVHRAWNCDTLPFSFLLWLYLSKNPPTDFFHQWRTCVIWKHLVTIVSSIPVPIRRNSPILTHTKELTASLISVSFSINVPIKMLPGFILFEKTIYKKSVCHKGYGHFDIEM